MQGLISRALAAFMLVGSPALAQSNSAPGVTATEIKIGQTMPYSGPASAFGAYGRTMSAYFAMLNERGGINGRKINMISLDDAFAPPKTVEQMRRLVEGDEVAAIVGQLGTPTSIAVAKYLNTKKVPQILISSGSPKLNDASLPWTTLFYAYQIVEAQIYAKFILQTKPDAKIGVVYQNDDFGRGYLNALKDGLGDKASAMIVKEMPYELSDATIDSQILAIKAAGADTLFDASTPKFVAQAIRKTSELGWKPLHIALTASTQISTVLKPAGVEASKGLVTSIWLKGVDDPSWSNDPGVKEFVAFMQQWAPKESAADTVTGLAYSAAQVFAHIMEKCGNDLSRENIMKQALSLQDLQLPLFIPGVKISTSSTQRVPWRSAMVVEFDGVGWKPLGPVVSASERK